jgi:hypothetical protein
MMETGRGGEIVGLKSSTERRSWMRSTGVPWAHPLALKLVIWSGSVAFTIATLK